MGVEQKVAVITGALQGIGAALVKAYRDRNYRVVATSRSIKPSNDDEVVAVPGDIADRKTAERAISEGMARFGRVDTLVNNAGIFIAKPFTQYTKADCAAILGVNLAGFFHITQLAVAESAARRRLLGPRQQPARPPSQTECCPRSPRYGFGRAARLRALNRRRARYSARKDRGHRRCQRSGVSGSRPSSTRPVDCMTRGCTPMCCVIACTSRNARLQRAAHVQLLPT